MIRRCVYVYVWADGDRERESVVKVLEPCTGGVATYRSETRTRSSDDDGDDSDGSGD
jgi:hypothetical protein